MRAWDRDIDIDFSGILLGKLYKEKFEIRYLVIFDCGWFDKICDRIKYLISEKKMALQIVLIIILQK